MYALRRRILIFALLAGYRQNRARRETGGLQGRREGCGRRVVRL